MAKRTKLAPRLSRYAEFIPGTKVDRRRVTLMDATLGMVMGDELRAELESLISDPRIPEDRRTWYALLGLRRRRAHDLRRTGISLAQDDGADSRVLRWGTHAPPGETIDAYTTLAWSTLCRAVGAIRVERQSANLLTGQGDEMVPSGHDRS